MTTPFLRLHRYRRSSSIRALMTDCSLEPKDLILPIFIHDGPTTIHIPQMPYAPRYSQDDLLTHVEKCLSIGIIAIALFPVIDSSLKTLCAKEAWNPNGLIPKTIIALKKKFPSLIIIADIALDPFHLAGQDGLLNEHGQIDNDKTLPALVSQSLCYAKAGADILAPSDMMDGRIQEIRQALSHNQLNDPLLLSYCTKFASHLYGPFRHAVDSAKNLGSSNKKTYQMDYRSRFQIAKEQESDEEEGADLLMVKPAVHYLDVIQTLSSQSSLPVWAYHVSGECSMLWHGAQHHLFDFDNMLMETLWSIRRAGANKILTYFAYEASLLLKKDILFIDRNQ